jgi:hypothetical protein
MRTSERQCRSVEQPRRAVRASHAELAQRVAVGYPALMRRLAATRLSSAEIPIHIPQKGGVVCFWPRRLPTSGRQNL